MLQNGSLVHVAPASDHTAALESFGDCVGADDEPPEDAMQTLLRLTQDTDLCAEQMQEALAGQSLSLKCDV